MQKNTPYMHTSGKYRFLLSALRMLFSGVVGLISLLAVVPAPNSARWIVALFVTEFGYFAFPLPLLLLVPGWHRSRAARLRAVLCVARAAPLLSPPVRPLPVAAGLPARLDAAFGRTPGPANAGNQIREKPLRLRDPTRASTEAGQTFPRMSIEIVTA